MIPRICIQPSISSGTPMPVLWSEIESAMRDPRIQSICDQIKLLDGQDPEELSRLKKQLPIITPHACRFLGDGKRKSANAVPSGLVMLDIDHIDDPRDFFSAHIFPCLQQRDLQRSDLLRQRSTLSPSLLPVTVSASSPSVTLARVSPMHNAV